MSDTLCNEKRNLYIFRRNSCIITETRTPRYWYNYLWNENHYCAQISQTGHGRSYYLSEKADMCMMNQGRCKIIYLSKGREKQRMLEYRRRSIKYGSRKLSVRTQHWIFRIQSSYQNIASSWRLFVPEEGYQEVWTLKIKIQGKDSAISAYFQQSAFIWRAFLIRDIMKMYRCMETDYDEKVKGCILQIRTSFRTAYKRYNAFLAASEPAYAYDGNLEAFCRTTSTITRLDASASALFQRPDIVVKGKDCTNSKAALLFWAVCCSIKLCYSQEKKKNYSLYLESVNHLKRQGRYRKSFPILQLWKRNLKKQKRIIWKNIVR